MPVVCQVQQHHVPLRHAPGHGCNADQVAEPGRRDAARRVAIGALCQDWTGIEVDPERVGSGPPDQHISRPGVVFTERDVVPFQFAGGV